MGTKEKERERGNEIERNERERVIRKCGEMCFGWQQLNCCYVVVVKCIYDDNEADNVNLKQVKNSIPKRNIQLLLVLLDDHNRN